MIILQKLKHTITTQAILNKLYILQSWKNKYTDSI